MARRLISTMVLDEAGNRLGGTGTEVRIYTDAALTTPATVYANSSSGTTIALPLCPNAGVQTTITANILTTDTVITVSSVTGWRVGDLCAIYDGTNTVYRVITSINVGAKQFTLDAAVGTAFSTANTFIGNADMQGHINAWLDDAQDYYLQTKDVASTRVLPPIVVPIRVPGTSVAVQEEGSAVASQPTINFISAFVTAANDVPNSRINVTGPTAGVAAGASAVGDTAAEGANTTIARSDHRHSRESFATPAIVHGTAAAAGAATTPIRSDSTIATFDATAPVTQAPEDVAAVGVINFASRRDHKHGMPPDKSVLVTNFAADINGAPNVGVSTTVYSYVSTFGNGNSGMFTGGTETDFELVMPFAGSLRNLYVRTLAAQSGTGSLVFTIRKNGADTALTLTVAAGAAAGYFSDLTHSFTFAAGDKLNMKIVNNATAISTRIANWVLELRST